MTTPVCWPLTSLEKRSGPRRRSPLIIGGPSKTLALHPPFLRALPQGPIRIVLNPIPAIKPIITFEEVTIWIEQEIASPAEYCTDTRHAFIRRARPSGLRMQSNGNQLMRETDSQYLPAQIVLALGQRTARIDIRIGRERRSHGVFAGDGMTR